MSIISFRKGLEWKGFRKDFRKEVVYEYKDGRTDVDSWASEYEVFKREDKRYSISDKNRRAADSVNGLYGRSENDGSSIDIQKNKWNSSEVEFKGDKSSLV